MGSSALNKKTKSPGYQKGNHWVTCDICGFALRNKDARVTWDNLVVCPEDWNPRQPQDFVRGTTDDMSPKGLVRTEGTDSFIDVTFESIVDPIPAATHGDESIL